MALWFGKYLASALRRCVFADLPLGSFNQQQHQSGHTVEPGITAKLQIFHAVAVWRRRHKGHLRYRKGFHKRKALSLYHKMRTAALLVFSLFLTVQCAVSNIPNDYQVFDYVVLGGGGAGSAMASRLSESPSKNVLVVQYGNDDPCYLCDNTTQMTMIFSGLYTSNGDDYFSTPQLFRGRSIREVRTGLPGGGTRYYGAVSIPSSKKVFDTKWPAGYDYNTMLPYLRKFQDHYCNYFNSSVTNISAADCALLHGKGGPMSLSSPYPGVDYQTVVQDFYKSASEFNVSVVPDAYNPQYQKGDYVFPITSFQNRANKYDLLSNRSRASTWTGYLPLSVRQQRGNLKFAFNSEARQLIYATDLLMRPDLLIRLGINVSTLSRTPKVVGVLYLQNDTLKAAFATKQIILSGGVTGTPHFLQHNGIGPTDLLTQKGIAVVADNSQVGQNLAVHQAVSMVFVAKQPVPTTTTNNGDMANMQMTSPYNEGYPDVEVELKFGVGVRSIDPPITAVEDFYLTTPASPEGNYPFISTIVTVTNPMFRGSVNVTGPKFSSPAEVEYGWPKDAGGYATSVDYSKLTWGFNRMRQIFTGNNSFARKWVQYENCPGVSSTLPQSTNDLFYSAQYQHSVYHLTGSVGLGRATDLQGRVKGITGLTVCDNSLIPHPPNANPTTTMLALCERIAEYVKTY
ncbi:choline dehydrogenase [Planoprotostelium fungivorum]|uniref:Choline dehydrogenase n=1 Tax=Planoprotostelium fungivorum TaxID=1890364 RepID=A0A2P6NL05_9EUKA|nr:choline dehydrogenase [Planoprotostelium fungivorum]